MSDMLIKIKNSKKIQKKIVAIMLTMVLFASLFPVKTHAFLPDPINPFNGAKQAMEGIMEKFGFKKEAIAEAAQNFNVLGNKKQNPQVMVTFNPTNPNPGEKVTATAEPMYFGNSGESLYYTWYLKHRGEENTEENLDTVFKVRAAKIIASDGNEKVGDGEDNDGYKAFFGGHDQQGKGIETGNHCFFYDVDKGAEYEFPECEHLFPNIGDFETGDGEFGEEEEKLWETDPANPDTAGLGNSDEANVAGLGVKSFTWTYREGDQVGVAIEGVSYIPTAYEDSTYKIMWALSKNKCDLPEEPFGELDADEAKEALLIDPPIWPDCPDGCEFKRTIKIRDSEYSQAPSSSYQIKSSNIKVVNQIIQLSSRKFTDGAATGGTVITDGTTTTAEGGAVGIGPGMCGYSVDTLPEETTCYEMDEIPLVSRNGSPDDDGYENFSDRSCCPSDGAPEPDEDCALFEQKRCSILSSTASFDESESPDYSMDPESSIFEMEMSDFNKCLLENFVDPADSGEGGGGGGSDKRLDVTLSYSPKNPINVPLPAIDPATGELRPDTSAINADEITIDSNIDNATDSEFLNYSWNVYTTSLSLTEVSDETAWGEPVNGSLVESSQTEGLGLKNLKFKSRFPADVKLIRVKLTTSENAYDGERTGHSDVIIPIITNQNAINVYPVEVSSPVSKLSTKRVIRLSPGTSKCVTDNQNDPVCDVVKNQIIAAEVNDKLSDYAWYIDGEPIANPDGLPIGSGSADTNRIYFPITKETGDTFSLELSAIRETEGEEQGEKVNLTRAFRVVDPEITITSNDEDACVPLLKGYYIDLDDVSWPDYSETEFETLNGSLLDLKVDFTGETPPDDSIVWTIDGNFAATGDNLIFPIIKPIGESYSVSVSGLYSQDNLTAKALLEYWDINYDGLYEKNSSKTIEVKVVGALSDSTTSGKINKFLAAIAVGFPSYLSFLFRLILTTALMIFTYRVVLVVIPQARKKKNYYFK